MSEAQFRAEVRDWVESVVGGKHKRQQYLEANTTGGRVARWTVDNDHELFKYLISNLEIPTPAPITLSDRFAEHSLGKPRWSFARPIIEDLQATLGAPLPFRSGDRVGGVVVAVATGGGKTRIGGVAIALALSQRIRRVVWLAPGRVLLDQARASLSELLAHENYALETKVRAATTWRMTRDDQGRFAGLERRTRKVRRSYITRPDAEGAEARVSEIEFMTHSRWMRKYGSERDGRNDPPELLAARERLVIVDEAHLGMRRGRTTGSAEPTRPVGIDPSIQYLLDDPATTVIGLTATPRVLIARGWKVAGGNDGRVTADQLSGYEGPRIVSQPVFRLEASLSELDKLTTWLAARIGRNKKTLVLAPDRTRAVKIARGVNEKVVARRGKPIAEAFFSEPDATSSEAIWGKGNQQVSATGTPIRSWTEHMADVLERFKDPNQAPLRPAIDVLVAVNMLAVGFDVKDILTVVVDRAAHDRDFFEQCIGRGSRILARGAADRFRIYGTLKRHAQHFETLYPHAPRERVPRHPSLDEEPFGANPRAKRVPDEAGRRWDPTQVFKIRASFVPHPELREAMTDPFAGLALEDPSVVLRERPSRADPQQTVEWIVDGPNGSLESTRSFLASLEHVRTQNGSKVRLSPEHGLRVYIGAGPSSLSWTERDELARYVLLLTAYLESSLMTLGDPAQCGRHIDEAGYQIGDIDLLFPVTQPFHEPNGRPVPLHGPQQVPSVFDHLRRIGGESRDSAGVDVERLQDENPHILVRFGLSPCAALDNVEAQLDWINLWSEVLAEAWRFASGEKPWELPTPARRDSLLPTASPEVWFPKFLPELPKAMVERFTEYARQNRAHWAAGQGAATFWASVWPVTGGTP